MADDIPDTPRIAPRRADYQARYHRERRKPRFDAAQLQREAEHAADLQARGLHTVKEATALVGRDAWALYKEVQKGHVPAVREGSHVYLAAAPLAEYLGRWYYRNGKPVEASPATSASALPGSRSGRWSPQRTDSGTTNW